MKTWSLPDTIRGGGVCLALAAMLAPLAAQEGPRKVQEPAVSRRGEGGQRGGAQAGPGERAAREEAARSAKGPGERAARDQAPVGPGEGAARRQAQGQGQTQNQGGGRSQGQGHSQAQGPAQPQGPAQSQGPAQPQGPAQSQGPAQGQRPAQGLPAPVRRPIQIPDSALGQGPAPSAAPPSRPAPASGGSSAAGGSGGPANTPSAPPWRAGTPSAGTGTQHPEPGRPSNPPSFQPGGGSSARPGAAAPGSATGPTELRSGPGARTSAGQPRGGADLRHDPGGSLREVRTPSGAVVRTAPDGQRRVMFARPDGRQLVATPGGRAGYVQRPLRIQDQAFVQRTYVRRGVATALVYRPWPYRGVTYAVYQPCRYYRPAFYTWSRRPWRRPVYYSWGWYGQPWFAYYRGWCAPYPYYVSPVFWLTDFMIAITLEDAYQARLDSAAAAPPPPAGGLTPEAKQAIADEVQRQLEQEEQQQRAAAQGALPEPSGPPPLFSDQGPRIFLVHTGVPAYRDGQEHFLSEGDVIQLQGAPPAGGYAEVVVLASRNPECPKGSRVSVRLEDLQEMQNHMQATLDQGLGQLQAQQGQNGLPAVPAQNLGAANAPYLGGVQPDADAAAQLAEVARDASEPGPVISQGMTVEEVHRVLGNPRQTATVGGKLIEVFANFKVTYLEGRVTNVE